MASLKLAKKYQWSLTSESSPETTALLVLAKERLPTALEAKFAVFPVDLIDTHGRDIIVGSNEPSRTSSPAPPPSSAPASGGAPGRAKKVAAYVVALEKLRVDVLMICRRAQLRQIQSMSYLEVACVANTSHLHPARKLNRPGHCKARPGQRVKL